MLMFRELPCVYLHRAPVDFRKSINGLAVIVEQQLSLQATEKVVFNGYLQVDGYAAYHQGSNKLVGCWAHARRKFKEALVAQGNPKQAKSVRPIWR